MGGNGGSVPVYGSVAVRRTGMYYRKNNIVIINGLF
jgi:hypothetical protein